MYLACLTSSRFVTKANYLSLNNIRLGYSLPKEFLHTISMNSLDIYASGDNLMLFSARKGFNPAGALSGQSSTYTYAPMSTISLGVKANF